MVTVIASQGTYVLLEIPSMHKLVQYFQSLYTCRNEDTYELKDVHISNFEVDLCSSSVEYCSISNVNSLYQCSCKQCCDIAVYAMCYSIINLCGYWTSGTLSALASNRNTLYNVMARTKRAALQNALQKSCKRAGCSGSKFWLFRAVVESPLTVSQPIFQCYL